jgi:uncharacterized protein (DUF1330 family)
MAAYFISDAAAKNPEALEIFRERAASSISRYGGRYLVRCDRVETVEGNWKPSVIIVIEFPDLARAKTWYRSAEYASALAVRDDAISRNLILVEETFGPKMSPGLTRV